MKKGAENTSEFAKSAFPGGNYIFFWVVIIAVIFLAIGFALQHHYANGWLSHVAMAIKTASVAVITGSAFTAIIKSGQFSTIFQNHLFRVMYDPINAESVGAVEQSWTQLTDALLKRVLPRSYENASAQIMSSFFDDEIEYHYDNLRVHHTFRIDRANNMAQMETETTARIYLSKSCARPQLKQSVKLTDGEPLLIYLSLGSSNDLQEEIEYIPDPDIPDKYYLIEDLSKYENVDRDGNSWVEYKKVDQQLLNLNTDPTYILHLKRFTKGMQVTATIEDGMGLAFETIYDKDAVYRYTGRPGREHEWTLAPLDGLLLPGHGYTICVVPEQVSP